MSKMLNGEGVRDAILNQGKTTTESVAFFWGNITKGVQQSTKGAVAIDSGGRIGTGAYKASKDFARGDAMCGTLCSISIGCETLSGVLVWFPIPYKVGIVSTLKATSVGCLRFRDLCAGDPSGPLC